MKINAIQGALMEARGEGHFEQRGKTIAFFDTKGRVFGTWFAATTAQAAQMLRIFRKAPNHVEAA